MECREDPSKQSHRGKMTLSVISGDSGESESKLCEVCVGE